MKKDQIEELKKQEIIWENESEKNKTEGPYKRSLMQSFFTAPEWRNVDMAEELAEFLEKGHPFYQYPYFHQVRDFWRIFKHSYDATRKYHTFREVFFSEYMMTNLFVGVSTSISFISKGLLSFLLRPIFRILKVDENNTPFQKEVAAHVAKYAAFIHHTPFYQYPFWETLKSLVQVYRAQKLRTGTDAMTLFTVALDLLGRVVFSFVPRKLFGDTYTEKEGERIHIATSTGKGDKRMFSIKKYPRYDAFKEEIAHFYHEMGQEKILKIAGHDRIHIKFEIQKPKDISKAEWKHILENKVQEIVKVSKKNSLEKNNRFLFSYENHINGKVFVAIDARVPKLRTTLGKSKASGFSIKQIHDF